VVFSVGWASVGEDRQETRQVKSDHLLVRHPDRRRRMKMHNRAGCGRWRGCGPPREPCTNGRVPGTIGARRAHSPLESRAGALAHWGAKDDGRAFPQRRTAPAGSLIFLFGFGEPERRDGACTDWREAATRRRSGKSVDNSAAKRPRGKFRCMRALTPSVADAGSRHGACAAGTRRTVLGAGVAGGGQECAGASARRGAWS
jgi:hypothetical protein